jgi:hypothetical protein
MILSTSYLLLDDMVTGWRGTSSTTRDKAMWMAIITTLQNLDSAVIN